MANPFHQPYIVTQEFGPTDFNWEPAGYGYAHYHAGIDMVGPSANCPLYPVMDGYVFAAGKDRDGALYVIVQTTGYFTSYWHLSKITCKNGDFVNTATQIGNQGSTGNSSGPHLHLELRKAGVWGGSLSKTGTPIDPAPFLTGDNRDMEALEIVRGIRRITNPNNHVSDEIIKADAARIVAEGRIDGVLADNMTSVPWRNPEAADVYAIEAYAQADNMDNPHDFAVNKVLSQTGPVQVFREVLGTFKGWLAERDRRIDDLTTAAITQQDLINQGNDTIATIKQQQADLQTQVQQRDAEIIQLKEALVNASDSPPASPAPIDTPTETPGKQPPKTIWEQLVEAVGNILNKKG